MMPTVLEVLVDCLPPLAAHRGPEASGVVMHDVARTCTSGEQARAGYGARSGHNNRFVPHHGLGRCQIAYVAQTDADEGARKSC